LRVCNTKEGAGKQFGFQIHPIADPMSETLPAHPRLTDPLDAQLAQYRGLSAAAVAGLILGLLGPVALIDPVLWAVPLLGILVNGWALRRIARRSPALTGGRAALAGLILSTLLSAAAVSDWLAHRWLLRREARQFALQWFELLAQGQPQKAYQLVLSPSYRRPFDGKLWDFYRESTHWRAELEDYVSQPVVRALLALGPKAQVRCYQTEGQWPEEARHHLAQVYAVSYDQAGRQETFFVRLELQRVKLAGGRANWRLVRAEGGIRPAGWQQKGHATRTGSSHSNADAGEQKGAPGANDE
jgi:hypothetical protein